MWCVPGCLVWQLNLHIAMQLLIIVLYPYQVYQDYVKCINFSVSDDHKIFLKSWPPRHEIFVKSRPPRHHGNFREITTIQTSRKFSRNLDHPAITEIFTKSRPPQHQNLLWNLNHPASCKFSRNLDCCGTKYHNLYQVYQVNQVCWLYQVYLIDKQP